MITWIVLIGVAAVSSFGAVTAVVRARANVLLHANDAQETEPERTP